jgi:hypothetical protein
MRAAADPLTGKVVTEDDAEDWSVRVIDVGTPGGAL